MSPFCGEDKGKEDHLIQTVQEIQVDTALFEDKRLTSIGKIISN